MNRVAPLLLLFLVAPGVFGDIVINEIFYAPPDKTVHEEFIELYNNGDTPVNIGGWYLSDAVEFTVPQDTIVDPGSYLIIAQDPGVLKSRYGSDLPVVGPFDGRLSNEGEEIVLMISSSLVADTVDYKRGFPWPTVGGDGSTSIELIRPDCDNDLGGSWRAAGLRFEDPFSHTFIEPEEGGWSYRKGTSEPPAQWRQLDFVEDASWTAGQQASIGYGDGDDNTIIGDMSNNYSSLYLRKEFVVEREELLSYSPLLRVYVDDGAIFWINDTEVARFYVETGEKHHDDLAYNHEASWEEVRIQSPEQYLHVGTNVLAIHAMNSSLASSDLSVDAALLIPDDVGSRIGEPTPGARNSVFAANTPPHIRQVKHSPAEPVEDDVVTVTAKVTDPDGVARVRLLYQTVDPGAYIPIIFPNMSRNEAYDDPANWQELPMHDDGADGDAAAGDDIFSVRMPASLQRHRRLIRYRIALEDAVGLDLTVPYPDDPQPNFAYFCYDGVPAWTGAIDPTSSNPALATPVTYDETVMRSLPVYHLISRAEDVTNCQYNPGYDNGVYRFAGTLVYDGVVYDHVRYRVRGKYSTFLWGKNKWKFNFHRGHRFQARDNHGRKYRKKWDKISVGTGACPWWQYPHVPFGSPQWNRGTGGMVMNETLAFTFHNLTGALASHTNYFHFRVIDDEDEFGATQYDGDFWGLYFTIEQADSRFLEERGLPDGNVYKMDGAPSKWNQGPTQTASNSDINDMTSSSSGYNRQPPQPFAWWEEHVDLPGYYDYDAAGLAVNNSDRRPQHNCLMYHNAETDAWTMLPWDLDLTFEWGTHYTDWEHFSYALTYEAYDTANRNRAREVADLLFNGEQASLVVDEMASFIWNSDGSPSFVQANRAMWDYHPRKDSKGWFYKHNEYLETRDFAGLVKYYKRYLTPASFFDPQYPQYSYGGHALSAHAEDSDIPHDPSIQGTGDAGYPVDGLTFRAGPFEDPNGSNTFGAMKWRIGEVSPPGEPPFAPGRPARYEIQTIWESDEFTAYEPDVTIPWWAVRIGHTYRVRVRMMDVTDRWSHWSQPIEFTVGLPQDPSLPQFTLRITELMYHPPDLDAVDGDRFEFIKLYNSGDMAVDLSGYFFSDGIQFVFAEGMILRSGRRLLLAKDLEAFAVRYDTSRFDVIGDYTGNLDNGGERLVLSSARGEPVIRITYEDHWYGETDGAGYSLVVADEENVGADYSEPESWRQSYAVYGSPGEADLPQLGGWQLPGDANQDGALDISDCVGLLLLMFQIPGYDTLPCEGETIHEGGNVPVLDTNGDGSVDIADAVYVLQYLFAGGSPPARGTTCIRVPGCQTRCDG